MVSGSDKMEGAGGSTGIKEANSVMGESARITVIAGTFMLK